MKTNKNVVITKGSHSRTSLSGIYNACRCQIKGFPLLNRCVEDAEQKSLSIRLCYKKAFTLIELLVVVLIIGILAAVALPQYQKIVEKSRASQALALLASAYEHATVYYLEHGNYPTSFAEMDFDVPWTGNTVWRTGRDVVRDTKSNADWSLQLYHALEGSLIVFVGRISGKYAGGGFEVVVNGEDGRGRTKEIFCVERTQHGITLSSDLKKGAYCTGIMGGKYKGKEGTFRVYELP